MKRKFTLIFRSGIEFSCEADQINIDERFVALVTFEGNEQYSAFYWATDSIQHIRDERITHESAG